MQVNCCFEMAAHARLLGLAPSLAHATVGNGAVDWANIDVEYC